MRTPILFALSLAALGLFNAGPLRTSAHALRIAMPPPPRQATTIAEVQTNLAAIEPQVQACGVSTSTTTPARVMVHVHAFPQGFWGVTFGSGRSSTPTIGGRGTTPFERCVAQAIEDRIGTHTEPFTGTRARTIDRRFRLVAAATPPTVVVAPPTVGPISAAYSAAVRRVLATHRAQIQACFPHTPPARATRSTIRMRVEVSPSGAIRITGLELPGHVDFANSAQCIERALDGVTGPTQPGILRGEVPYTVQIDAAPAAGDPAVPN